MLGDQWRISVCTLLVIRDLYSFLFLSIFLSFLVVEILKI